MKEFSTDIKEVLAAIANPQIPVAERMAMAASRFTESRKTISRHTFSMLKIASRVRSELKLPIEEFLRDNGIAEDQLGAFTKYDNEFADQEKLLSTLLLTPGLVEKLLCATGDVRERALNLVVSGHILSEAALVSAAATPVLMPDERPLGIRDTSMHDAARKLGERAISDVTSRAVILHDKLVAVSNLRAVDDLSRAAITADARELLVRFEDLFGTEFVDLADWMIVGIGEPDKMYLSQAHYALSRLSKGLFDVTLLKKWTPYHQWSAIDGIGFLAGKQSNKSRKPDRLTPRHFKQLTALEVCARTGLGALGLEAANYNVVGVNEVDDDLAKLLQSLRKDWRVLDNDIRTPEFHAEVAKLTAEYGQITLISGSLPKAPFKARSIKGIRTKELLSHTQSLVKALRPRAFLFETHKGLKNGPFAELWDGVQKAYSDLGYVARLYTVKAASFGVRQDRTFTFIVGIEADRAVDFQLPRPFKGTFNDLKTFVGELPFPHRHSIQSEIATPKTSREVGLSNYAKWITSWVDSHGESTELLPDLSASQEEATFKAWLKHGFNHAIVSEPGKVGQMNASSMVPLDFELACRIQGVPLDWPVPGRYLSKDDPVSNRAYSRQCQLLLEQTPPQVVYGMAQAIRAALTGELVDDIDFQDVIITGRRYRQQGVVSVRRAPPLAKMWQAAGAKDPEMRKALYWQFAMRTVPSPAWQEDIADAQEFEETNDFDDAELAPELANQRGNRVRFRTKIA